MVTKKTLTTRVRRGIQFLDKKYGKKWRKKIDLKELDLNKPKSCILGQTDSDYYSHSRALGLVSDNDAAELGFLISDAEGRSIGYFTAFDRLTKVWKTELRKLGIK